MALDTAMTQMFGCPYPVQLAGMGGASSAGLAAAVCDAGGLGMLSGVVPREHLLAQLDAMPPGKPFGVNFLVPFLDLRNVEAVAGRSALVEFFYGEPDGVVVDVVHQGGARAAWQVGSATEGQAAVDARCDLVVAQGVEAGGHVRGTQPLLELLEELCVAVDVPVIAAGGIGDATAVRAAMAAGAAGVRVGTRFLAAHESVAHPDYVARLIAASAADTVLTTRFDRGWPDAPHRVLRSCVAAGEARGAEQMWTPDWPTADFGGDVASRALYAGTSVEWVTRRQPVAEIIAELFEGFEAVSRRTALGDSP